LYIKNKTGPAIYKQSRQLLFASLRWRV